MWNFLDIVKECDNLQYQNPHDPGKGLDEMMKRLYFYMLPTPEGQDRIYGYMLEDIVRRMPWGNQFLVDHDEKTVTHIRKEHSDQAEAEMSTQLQTLLEHARKVQTFALLKGWRNEQLQLHGTKGVTIERAGTTLFGILTIGVHLTAYVPSPDGMKLWISKRAATKQTYPGMLDNTVAGGIGAGESPFSTLIREAAEEASLPEELIRTRAKTCGAISYFHVCDSRTRGEENLMQPEIEYVYDIELPLDMTPKPADDEVEIFFLWTIPQVKEAMKLKQFKPNCACVLLDFFIRHGILTPENEPDYVDIISRLHRKLPFPMPVFDIEKARE